MNESELLNFPALTVSTVGTQGISALTSTSIYGNRSVLRSRTGQENPRFRQQIAAFQNATTPFNGFNVRVNREGFNFTTLWKPPTGQRNYEAASGVHHLGPISDPVGVSLTEAQNQAIRRLVNEILARRAAFQGGTFIAEINDTIRGIRHPLRALREGLSTYHRTAKKLKRQVGAAQLRKVLASTWLEYQFGWLQLSRDIDNGFANLARISKPRGVHFSASGKSETRSVATPSASLGITGLNAKITTIRTLTHTATVTYRGAYKVDPPHGWDAKSWGLSPQDFLPSVWEAIPYSFAVDYFTNVGTIIQAYAYIAADLAWVARSTRKQINDVHQGVKFVPGNPPQYPLITNSSGPLGFSSVVSTRVERDSLMPSRIIPTLSFRVPEAGSLKWLNIAALITLKTL